MVGETTVYLGEDGLLAADQVAAASSANASQALGWASWGTGFAATMQDCFSALDATCAWDAVGLSVGLGSLFSPFSDTTNSEIGSISTLPSPFGGGGGRNATRPSYGPTPTARTWSVNGSEC